MNYLDKFRYSFDNLDEINTKPKVQKKLIIKKFENPKLKTLLSNSVRVSKEIFPKVQSAIDDVFKNLNLENKFNFFITANHFETQAYCSMMPESNNAEVVITSKMIDLLNNDELKSVIAHEVSHFYYQHNLYPNPNTAKSQLEFLNLLHLSRAAEISADRAGFLGSGNLENCLRAMLKITSGLGEEHLQFNFSNYLNQLRELEEVKGDKLQLYATHPTFLNRMQALIWFSMSHEYHEYFETDKKGVYDLNIVDQKINNSIKKVTGNEIDIFSKEIVERVLMWGALWIYLSDKKFLKKDQDQFKKRFGEKKSISVLGLLKISKLSTIEKKVFNALDEASALLKTKKTEILKELKNIFSEIETPSIAMKKNYKILVDKIK